MNQPATNITEPKEQQPAATEQNPEEQARSAEVEASRQKLLLLMQDVTGMDLSDNKTGFNLYEMLDTLMNMENSGAMESVMDKMAQAANSLKETSPDATLQDQLDAMKNVVDTEVNNEINSDEPKQESDLGGVNGSAVTYEVSKPSDEVIEGSNIRSSIQNGAPLITSTFMANATAAGTMIDAKVDNDAANQPNFDISEPEVTVSQIAYGR